MMIGPVGRHRHVSKYLIFAVNPQCMHWRLLGKMTKKDVITGCILLIGPRRNNIKMSADVPRRGAAASRIKVST